MSKFTSVIMTCFNQTRFQTHMSMASIAALTKFTDPEDFELIVMDPIPKYKIRDDYNVLKIDKHIILDEDPGYTACMNVGAGLAKGDYLVFIQNDVFVHEGWLPGLRQYLEKGYEVVFPDQIPRSREYINQTYQRGPFDPDSLKGGRDAGLMMLKREVFDRMKGWDEDLSLLAERDFYERMNANWTDTNKVIITHIMAATNLERLDNRPEEYESMMGKDAKKLNG